VGIAKRAVAAGVRALARRAIGGQHDVTFCWIATQEIAHATF
jgi:hypothetical protein